MIYTLVAFDLAYEQAYERTQLEQEREAHAPHIGGQVERAMHDMEVKSRQLPALTTTCTQIRREARSIFEDGMRELDPIDFSSSFHSEIAVEAAMRSIVRIWRQEEKDRQELEALSCVRGPRWLSSGRS